MSESSALEIVSAYQDAWTSRDFETAAQYVAEDIVFRSSAGQHFTTLSDFLAMLTAFAERIQPRWELIAATEEGDNVLVLYKLFTSQSAPASCADCFTVTEGRIRTEMLVFDPEPFLSASQKPRGG
jgi:ketosteroid isomerase-like protein